MDLKVYKSRLSCKQNIKKTPGLDIKDADIVVVFIKWAAFITVVLLKEAQNTLSWKKIKSCCSMDVADIVQQPLKAKQLTFENNMRDTCFDIV